MEKLELTKQQEEFIQIYGKEFNKFYIFFPKIYKKLGDRQYQELSFKDLPEGIKKYIIQQFS